MSPQRVENAGVREEPVLVGLLGQIHHKHVALGAGHPGVEERGLGVVLEPHGVLELLELAGGEHVLEGLDKLGGDVHLVLPSVGLLGGLSPSLDNTYITRVTPL